MLLLAGTDGCGEGASQAIPAKSHPPIFFSAGPNRIAAPARAGLRVAQQKGSRSERRTTRAVPDCAQLDP